MVLQQADQQAAVSPQSRHVIRLDARVTHRIAEMAVGFLMPKDLERNPVKRSETLAGIPRRGRDSADVAARDVAAEIGKAAERAGGITSASSNSSVYAGDLPSRTRASASSKRREKSPAKSGPQKINRKEAASARMVDKYYLGVRGLSPCDRTRFRRVRGRKAGRLVDSIAPGRSVKQCVLGQLGHVHSKRWEHLLRKGLQGFPVVGSLTDADDQTLDAGIAIRGCHFDCLFRGPAQKSAAVLKLTAPVGL